MDIVTDKHSTFTTKDIAQVLNEHIDDFDLFHLLYGRLSNSKELIDLEGPKEQAPVFTTRKMLQIEMNLIKQAKNFAARHTHPVESSIIDGVIARFNKTFEGSGGLSVDQQKAIRHMLSGEQIACVIGFAGAGKTTCLEAVREAWEEAGYTVLGLAPTGKAERGLSEGGIRSMTVHKFLKAYEEGEEQLTDKTIVIVDEAGMIDSRRFEKLQSIVEEFGAKIVAVGDNNQLQSIEAGPAFRLICRKVKTVALETIVRQQVPWQREATRLFGTLQPRQALALYYQQGAFETVSESLPDSQNPDRLLDVFCLTRQVSGRIWKEMEEDYKAAYGRTLNFKEEGTFDALSKHKDFELYTKWRGRRKEAVEAIIQDFDHLKSKLAQMSLRQLEGIDMEKLEALVLSYKTASDKEKGGCFGKIEKMLRQMSYENIYDTRIQAKQVLVCAWAADLEAAPHHSHLMLAFTNRDANTLNTCARLLMREKGAIVGTDYHFKTKFIEEDDFGNIKVVYEDRTFAQGDRILFTRNDKRIGVENGTLGTILSLNQETITVVLDGKKKQELSFSPASHPFIDNGWATTIHKAQSANVDHVKKLASYEEYRNPTYVGMTRHRYSLKVYASDLDFWREEKIFDRLARVQEKLSGFDYLDEAVVTEKLKQNPPYHQMSPSEERAEREFWDSLEKAAASAFAGSRGKSLPQDSNSPPSNPLLKELDPLNTPLQADAAKIDLLNESYLLLGDSEEMRSSNIFKDPSDTRGKKAFIKNNPSASRTTNPAFQHHPQGHEQQSQVSVDSSSSKDQAHTGQQKDPYNQLLPFSLNKAEVEKRIQGTQDKINQDYQTKTIFTEKSLSFEEVDQQLKERIYELAVSIFGEPNRGGRKATYLRFGKSNGISVGMSGTSRGVYTNFTNGVKGGPLKMIEDQMNLGSPKEALKWANDWLGGHSITVERQIIEKAQESNKSTWTPITPIPKASQNPDIANNKYLNFMLKDGYQETARHAYRDEEGNLKGYVVRLEKEELDGTKHKKTPPLAYCTNERGFKAWKWQAFETGNKTPYGIEKLTQDPSKSVLVVSGEKTADVASKLLSEYHVLTWLGGDGSVGKTNWACLRGKDVTIWPDHDESGKKAAKTLKEIITQFNQEKGKKSYVSIVNLPEELPTKWDLADQLPEGWTLDTVRQMIKESETLGDTVPQKEQDTATQSLTSSELDPYTPLESSVFYTNARIDPFAQEKAEFEQERLPFHQEWCANLRFFCQHKRYPENETEISAAYWQGERLAAIEGRLYGEALAKGKRQIDEEKLTLKARVELAKNQSAPDHIMVFGKASDLNENQLKQFEQHVLIYQDKTAQLPNSSELNTIYQAIKVHNQFMKEGFNDRIEGQGSTASQVQRSSENVPLHNPPHNTSDIYRTLIEQQALLTPTINKEKEIYKEDNALMKEGISPQQLRFHQMQEVCAERLQRMNEKIQEIKAFTQEMKLLEMNRQNQRGIEM